ncbi:MAG: hypothetical protein ACI9MJ_000673 [Alphaproteobacteria bacterium]|jgi:hypothetical protein
MWREIKHLGNCHNLLAMNCVPSLAGFAGQTLPFRTWRIRLPDVSVVSIRHKVWPNPLLGLLLNQKFTLRI